MTRSRFRPAWAFGGVRGFEDKRMSPFQLRIEHGQIAGMKATFVYAHPETHRMFRWGSLRAIQLRDHPEGLIDLDPRMVRDAYERACVDAQEALDLFRAWLDPEPPNQPTRLRLVS